MLVQQITIDNKTKDGEKIPGMKGILDIALALKDSVMFHGAPGIGKSQGVYQWNQEQVAKHKNWNPNVCDVRLSMKEPVDMVGIPIPVRIDGKDKTVWAVPSMWPDNTYEGGTILLDEINQGQPSILNAAFQLIQDRALGDYKVPDGYVIVAAANPSCYNSTVTELSLPLCNRFSHFNVKPDFDGWFNYRMANNGNPMVLAFLKTQDSSLLFDTKAFEDRIGSSVDEDGVFTDIIPTPRSWEVIEKLIDLPNFSMLEKQYYATGRLGLALSSRLFNFIKDSEKYQSWQSILEKGENFKNEDEMAFWCVQLNCMQAINKEPDDTKVRKYVVNFIKATRALSSNPNKAMNITRLCNSPRLIKRPDLFNLNADAKDLLSIVATAVLG